MKIMILGAGAIGSLYGAKLSKLNDVTLVGRESHANQINKNGLKVSGIEKKTYRVNAVTKISYVDKNTLILLTTKVHDSENAIRSIKNLVRKDTIILCLQNGLYSENAVKRIIGNKCLVLRAITNFGAIFLKPGHINYTSFSRTSIEQSPNSGEIAENFAKCGLNGYVSGNIKSDMWKKLIFNSVLNPLTAILRIKNNEITDDKLNPLKKLIVGECLKVAQADEIKFDMDFVSTINKEFAKSHNISSMQQDLLKCKNTEIDYLNGAVVELGKKYGIKCPVNESLMMIIKHLEKVSKI